MEAVGTNLTNPQLPQFNEKNHDYWAITMRALFASQDIWELVENGYPEPVDTTTLAALTAAERDLLKDNRKKDSKFLFYIFQSVHKSIFPSITVEKKSKEAWDIIKKTYQGMGR